MATPTPDQLQMLSNLGRSQKAYQEYGAAGRPDLQTGASSNADQIRAAAKAKGIDLSPFGTTNKYGTDYTQYYTGGTAGMYDPTKAGQVLAQPDLKKDQQSGSLGTVGTTYTPPANPNADLINQLYQANLASQTQALQDKKNTALAGLVGQDDVINQSRAQGLNNNDAMATSNARIINEKLANQGVAGGDSITANVANQTAQGQNANDIEMNAGNQLKALEAQRANINNSASGDQLALLQQLQAAQQQAQINNNNTQQQFGLQLAGVTGQYGGQNTMQQNQNNFNNGIAQAGLTGMYGGQQTLAAQNQGFNQGIAQAGLTGMYNNAPTLAKSQQDWQNNFNLGNATGSFGNGQKTVAQQQLDSQNDPNSLDGQLKVAQAKYYADHGSYYAGGGSQSGANSANATAKNNSYTASIYDQLSQLDPSDYAGYLNANQGEIVKNIGQKAFDDFKKSVMSDQNAQGKADSAQGKVDLTIREKAIAAAQKDPDFLSGKSKLKDLIPQYEDLYNQ